MKQRRRGCTCRCPRWLVWVEPMGLGLERLYLGWNLEESCRINVAHGFVGALIDFIYYYFFFKESL